MKPLTLIAISLLCAAPAFAGDHGASAYGNGNGNYGNGNYGNGNDHGWDNGRDHRDRDPVVVDKNRTAWKLTKAKRDISDAIVMAKGNPALVSLLKGLRSDLDDLHDDVSSAPSVYDMMRDQQQQQPPVVIVQNPPPPPPPPQLYPMTDAQLRGLIAAIDRENFGNAKLRVVQQAAPANNFVCAQVLQILGRFNFANDKLAAVAAIKPRILDMQNSHLLFQAFQFDPDKAKLQAILQQ